jgi:hypothetical protein
MKPRRTLLVVINKKVEWGILSVAVKRVISGYTGRAARGGWSWPPATRWPRRWIILSLALDQAAVYMAAPGAGVGFAGYLRLLG